MVGDLLADNVDPDAVGQIAAQSLDRVFDYPRMIAQSLAPYAMRFGFLTGDGVALLNHLLARAGYSHREQMVAMAAAG